MKFFETNSGVLRTLTNYTVKREGKDEGNEEGK
jgi:hypothetical protein